jgi:hypothetical protein
MARLFGRAASQFFILLLVVVLALECSSISVRVVAFADVRASSETEQVQQQEPSEQQPQQTSQQYGQQGTQESERHLTSIPNVLVPLAGAEEKVASFEQINHSWSLFDIALCFASLVEALIFIAAFFYCNRQSRPFLLCLDFIARTLALCAALISLIAASIVSDLSGSMVLFDEMSFTIIILFLIQQAVLLTTKKPRTVVVTNRSARKRFRARMRYEGHASDPSNE